MHPIFQQLIADRHLLRVVLAVEGILALYHACMPFFPRFFAACTSAFVTVRSATAGNSIGAYSFDVPSARIAPVATTISPPLYIECHTAACSDADKRIGHSHWISSSIAMEADGPPMPVDVTETFTPSKVPV